MRRVRDVYARDGSRILAALSLLGIVAGGVFALTGDTDTGNAIWGATIAVMLVPLTWEVARSLLHGDVGVDVIALLAMAGALATGENLAGAIVALMLSGGNALEDAAAGRARRDLTALLERAPRTARRHVGDTWEEVPVDALAPGDVVLVRAGEIVPVDGTLHSEAAVLDESAMTGESLPMTAPRGSLLRSGTTNAGEAFEVLATKSAAESSYAALVKLVSQAETERAPFVRLADRYAVWFLAITVVLGGLAWVLSGNPVRAVAVLVVATPCPLILAAPIALVAGLSRLARAGVIVKGGGTIEGLGEAKTVLLDKTGTLTLGSPRVREVLPLDAIEADEVLRLAASVDQLSAHVLAAGLVADATGRGLRLEPPADVAEVPGQGIEGTVAGRRMLVGSAAFLASRGCVVDGAADRIDGLDAAEGLARVMVAADGRLVGAIVMADLLREDAPRMVDALRAAGVRHIAMVTGDREVVARSIAQRTGLDEVYAECSPEGKLDVVRTMQRNPDLHPIVMVGDGVNDAPALAMADIGIAMGTAGSTISAETADCVITVDRVDRVATAIQIGQRTLHIARQSILFGIGLSIAAMVFAALGYLPPVAGALLQEVIDVAVILNALRVLRG